MNKTDKKNKLSNVLSGGIYKEGLRQGRIIGFAYAGLMILWCVICLLMMITQAVKEPNWWVEYIANGDVVGTEYAGFLFMLPFCLVVPLLCLTVYNFLNTRAGADHWHALPQKRVSIFFSLLASVMTWGAIGLAISILPMAGYDLLAGGFSALLPWISGYFTSLLGCLQVAASVLLAMGISSTFFGQICASLLIIFLPRGLITVCYELVAGELPILPDIETLAQTGAPHFLDYSLNIVFGSVFGMEGLEWDISGWSVLYTMILTAVLMTAACLLFARRKSENAGQAANSRILAQIIPALLSFVVCAASIIQIWTSSINNCKIDVSDWILVGGLILLAIIIYFVLYAILIKSVRGIAKGFPGVGILAGLCAALFVTLSISGTVAMSFAPSEDNIKYVTFSLDRSSLGMNDSEKNNEYGRILASNVRFTDDNVKKCVSAMLKNNIITIKGSKRIWGEGYTTNLNVNIVTKTGRSITRRIYMSDSSYDSLGSHCRENQDFIDALRTQPGITDIKKAETWGDSSLTNNQRKELLGILVEEYRSNMESEKYYNGYEFSCIYISGKVKGRPYSQGYTIDGSTPKAAARYIQMINEKRPDSPEALLRIMKENPVRELKVEYPQNEPCLKCGKVHSGTKRFNYYNLAGEPTSVGIEELIESYTVYDEHGYYVGLSEIPLEEWQKNGADFFAEMKAQWNKPVDPSKPLYRCSFRDSNYHEITFCIAAAEYDSCIENWCSEPPLVQDQDVSDSDVSSTDAA